MYSYSHKTPCFCKHFFIVVQVQLSPFHAHNSPTPAVTKLSLITSITQNITNTELKACLANLGSQRHFKNSTGPETLEGPKRVQSKISSFYMLSNSPWYKWFHSVLNHLHFEGHLDCLLFLFLLISCYKYL